MADNLDKSRERARMVLTFVQEEVGRRNHHCIGTEYLLLGFVHEGEGIFAGVLDPFGATLEQARGQNKQVVNQLGRERPTAGQWHRDGFIDHAPPAEGAVVYVGSADDDASPGA